MNNRFSSIACIIEIAREIKLSKLISAHRRSREDSFIYPLNTHSMEFLFYQVLGERRFWRAINGRIQLAKDRKFLSHDIKRIKSLFIC